MNFFSLYALSSSESPNNYRYIGVTSVSLKKRLHNHLWDAKLTKTHKTNWINSVLNKGHNIVITELLSNISESDVEQIEIDNIRNYKDKYNLVNGTIGGEGIKGYKWTEKQYRLRKIIQPGISRKISLKRKGIPTTNKVFIQKCCIERKKPIIQLNSNYKFIAKYESITKASKETNIKFSSISIAANGTKGTTANGYYWIFESEYNENKINEIKEKRKFYYRYNKPNSFSEKVSKKYKMTNINTNEIIIFNSKKDLCSHFNTGHIDLWYYEKYTNNIYKSIYRIEQISNPYKKEKKFTWKQLKIKYK